MAVDTESRSRGVLLGLACGDALGRPVEFSPSERIHEQHGRVTEMLGHGTHGQPAGTVTDDTDMALCIARSLADRLEFDPDDVADRFVAWKETGPFDIGIMTAKALDRIRNGESWDEAGRREWEASPEGSNAGNGSLMRCVPYAIAFRNDHDELVSVSRQSSSITHADPRCQWACALYNRVVAGLVTGEEEPLVEATRELEEALPDEIREVAQSIIDYRREARYSIDLQNSGYVVTTLQAGLYHGLTGKSTEEAIVEAVMMGGDTDTIGAVTGGIAGARFGTEGLPERWLETISVRSEIEALSKQLVEFSR